MALNQEAIVSCTRCSSTTPIGQTTYDSNGRSLICFNCYNKMAKGLEPERVIQTAEAPDKVNYKCLSCGFNFSRSTSFQFGGHCFNCGKAAVQREQTREVLVRNRKHLLDY